MRLRKLWKSLASHLFAYYAYTSWLHEIGFAICHKSPQTTNYYEILITRTSLKPDRCIGDRCSQFIVTSIWLRWNCSTCVAAGHVSEVVAFSGESRTAFLFSFQSVEWLETVSCYPMRCGQSGSIRFTNCTNNTCANILIAVLGFGNFPCFLILARVWS